MLLEWPGEAFRALYEGPTAAGARLRYAVHQSLLEPRTAFLRKPYMRETLLDKVRELLDAAD